MKARVGSIFVAGCVGLSLACLGGWLGREGRPTTAFFLSVEGDRSDCRWVGVSDGMVVIGHVRHEQPATEVQLSARIGAIREGLKAAQGEVADSHWHVVENPISQAGQGRSAGLQKVIGLFGQLDAARAARRALTTEQAAMPGWHVTRSERTLHRKLSAGGGRVRVMKLMKAERAGVGRGMVFAASLWMLSAVLATPAVVMGVVGWCRRVERARAGRCRGCGYDLRATRERCPECGMLVGVGAGG